MCFFIGKDENSLSLITNKGKEAGKMAANHMLDKNIPVPLYYQLKQIILNQIETGSLKIGDMLPTELQLCEEYGVSRQTIRQAFGELVHEGYLYRHKGKGTFVAKPKIEEHFFARLETYNDEMEKKGVVPSTKLLEAKVTDGISSVNEILGIPLREKLLVIRRLRFADGEPIVHLTTHLPASIFKGLEREDLETHSLYDLMETKYGRRMIRVSRVIEAVKATSADVTLLGMSKNDAVCFVRTTGYCEGDLPMEYSKAYYRGDRTKFSLDVYR